MKKKWPSAQSGQCDLYLRPIQALSLPDKIPKDVHTLFVGVNPGVRSARIGHYYAGHSNYFWKLLFNSGIWPRRITTEDDDNVAAGGFGFTDTCKRPTPGTGALKKIDFAASRSHVTKTVKKHHPKLIVFVSKTAVRAFLGSHSKPVVYGIQTWGIEGCRVFVAPSTSGASLGDTCVSIQIKMVQRTLKRDRPLPPFLIESFQRGSSHQTSERALNEELDGLIGLRVNGRQSFCLVKSNCRKSG